MQREIDKSRGRIFDRRKTLIELARRKQPLDQRLGHRLTRAVMQGEAAQNLLLLQPMLVELRGKFDEIARDIGAGQQRIGHIRQQPVQRMAEFVKERARIVEAQEAGFALGRLHEIQHIDDDRQDLAIELFLLAKIAHPGAAAFRGPREIIADEKRDGSPSGPVTSKARTSS